ETDGTASISSSICLPPSSGMSRKNPVKLPPGRAMLFDEPARHRIGFEIDAYDRKRLCRLRHFLDRIRVAGEDDAALEGDELANGLVEPLELGSGKPGIDPHVLP